MGGKLSIGFLAPGRLRARTRSSRCENGDYAADLEIARAVPRAPTFPEQLDAPVEVETPGVETIEALAEFLDIDAAATSKAMPVVRADGALMLVLVRGDDRLSETKLYDALAGASRPATDEEIRDGVRRGWRLSRPGRVRRTGPRRRDCCVRANSSPAPTGTATTCSAWRRAATTSREFADLREPCEGDTCAECGGALRFQTAIEVGHIFNFGTFYSGPLEASFLDEDGQEKPIIGGSYGVGPGARDGGDRRAAPRRARHRLAAVGSAVRRPHRGAARARGAGGGARAAAGGGRATRSCSTTVSSERARSSPTPTSSAAPTASPSARRRSRTAQWTCSCGRLARRRRVKLDEVEI